jgi:hypothetical protein
MSHEGQLFGQPVSKHLHLENQGPVIEGIMILWISLHISCISAERQHIIEKAEKNPQEHFNGNRYVSSCQKETNMTRMRAVMTL